MDIVEWLRKPFHAENIVTDRCQTKVNRHHTEAAELIEKLRAENKELRAASEWRPIETAPKDGTEILCYDGCIIERVKWLRSNWSIVNGWFHTINPESLNSDNWNDPPEYCLAKPTHWMPLPSCPD